MPRPAKPREPYLAAFQRWREISTYLPDQELVAQGAAALSLLAGRLQQSALGHDAYYAANRALRELDHVQAMMTQKGGAA